MLPEGRYIELTNVEKIAWNVDSFASALVEGDIITCESEFDGYVRFYALGPDDRIYEMRRETDAYYGLYFLPIYANSYSIV